MGVNDLWRLLAPCGRRVDIQTLRGKVLAIDASIWLTQFIKAMRDRSDGRMIPNAHLLGSLRRILKLLHNKIRPVFVFDGGVPVLKKRIMQARRQKQETNVRKLKNAAQMLLANRLAQREIQNAMAKDNKKNESDRPVGVSDSFNLTKSDRDTMVIENDSSDDDDDDDDDMDGIDWGNGDKQTKKVPIVEIDNDDDEDLDSDENDFLQSERETEEQVDYIINQLPINQNGELEIREIKKLPERLQYEVIARLKDKRLQRESKRNEFIPAANDPKKYSEMQLSHFLKDVNMKTRLNAYEERLKAQGGDGKRIASDARRQYVLIDENETKKTDLISPVNRSSNSSSSSLSSSSSFVNDGCSADIVDGNKVVISFSKTSLLDKKQELFPKSIFEPEEDEDDDDEEETQETMFEQKNDKYNDDIYDTSISKAMKTAEKLSPWAPYILQKAMRKRKLQNEEEAMLRKKTKVQEELRVGDQNNVSTKKKKKPQIVLDSSDEEEEDDLDVGASIKKNDTQQRPQDVKKDKRFCDILDSESDDEDDFEFDTNTSAPLTNKKVNLEDTHTNGDSKIEENKSGLHSNNVEKRLLQKSSKLPEENNKVVEIAASKSAKLPEENTNKVIEIAASQSPQHYSSEKIIPASQSPQHYSSEKIIPASYESAKYNSDDTNIVLDERNVPESPEPILQDEEEIKEIVPASPEYQERENEIDDNNKTVVENENNDNEEIIPESPDELATMDNSENSMVVDSPVDPLDNKKNIVDINESDSSVDEIELPRNEPSGEEKKRLREETLKQLNDQNKSLLHTRNIAHRDAEYVTPLMLEEVKELLSLFGLPYVESPMEAEAQCAELETLGIVDGVVTEDCDAFLFGAKNVYKNIFDEKKFVEAYSMRDIERDIGVGRRGLIHLALLLGSDYTSGIKGVGIVNALEIVLAFPDLSKFREWINEPTLKVQKGKKESKKEKAKKAKAKQRARKKKKKKGKGRKIKKSTVESDDDLESDESSDISLSSSSSSSSSSSEEEEEEEEEKEKDSEAILSFKNSHRNAKKKWVVSDSFPSAQVIDAYEKPIVKGVGESKLEWDKPDVDRIKSFCSIRFGWSEEECTRQISRPLQEYSSNNVQSTLDSFVVSYRDNSRFAAIKSKRMQKAVKGLVKDKSPNVEFVNSIGLNLSKKQKTKTKK